MKPLDGTFAQNALKWGVAGLWVDGGRVPLNPDDQKGQFGHHKPEYLECETTGGIYGGGYKRQPADDSVGRWPANLIHDGSDEVVGLFPVTKSGDWKGYVKAGETDAGHFIGKKPYSYHWQGDQGSAARFFYCAKASRAERNAGLEGMPERNRITQGRDVVGSIDRRDGKGRVPVNAQIRPAANHHPTVKPVALMEHLCRLTRTPTGGVVLDPFMGSGSTGVACVKAKRDFIGIEIDGDYCEIAKRRIDAELAKPRQARLL